MKYAWDLFLLKFCVCQAGLTFFGGLRLIGFIRSPGKQIYIGNGNSNLNACLTRILYKESALLS